METDLGFGMVTGALLGFLGTLAVGGGSIWLNALFGMVGAALATWLAWHLFTPVPAQGPGFIAALIGAVVTVLAGAAWRQLIEHNQPDAAEAAPAERARIFISYRREGDAGHAGRIADLTS